MAKRNGRGYLQATYKTYTFKAKDPIIDELRTLVEDSGLSYGDINDLCRVSTTSMRNWFHGETRRPQFCTIKAVVRALGKDVRNTMKPKSLYHRLTIDLDKFVYAKLKRIADQAERSASGQAKIFIIKALSDNPKPKGENGD